MARLAPAARRRPRNGRDADEPRPRLAPGAEVLGERPSRGEPVYVVRRRDGREVPLSLLHYLVAACADGRRSPKELAAEVSARYGLPASAADVLRIIERRLEPAGIVTLRDHRRVGARGAMALTAGGALVLLAILGIAALALWLWPEGGEREADRPAPATAGREAPATTAAAVPQEPPRATTTQVPEAPAPAGPAVSPAEARSLNDAAFALMGAGRYEEALPDLRRAVAGLRGAGPADPYEAYANYNLGRSLLETGRCAEARAPLLRSATLQDRREVADALAEARACA